MESSYASLAIVFGLLAGLLALLKRWERRQGRGRLLEVVETVPLGGGKTLSAVRAGDRLLLIGAAQQSVSLVGELPAEAAQPSREDRTLSRPLEAPPPARQTTSAPSANGVSAENLAARR